MGKSYCSKSSGHTYRVGNFTCRLAYGYSLNYTEHDSDQVLLKSKDITINQLHYNFSQIVCYSKAAVMAFCSIGT